MARSRVLIFSALVQRLLLMEAALDSLQRHLLAVVRDAYVVHLALPLGLEHGLVEAAAVVGLGAEVGVVELVDIHVVGLQQPQGGVQVVPEAAHGGVAAFGADHHLVAPPLEGDAQLLLAVGVEARGVEIVHAAVEGAADEAHGVLGADTLDGKGPETVAGHHKACPAESHFLHLSANVNCQKCYPL